MGKVSISHFYVLLCLYVVYVLLLVKQPGVRLVGMIVGIYHPLHIYGGWVEGHMGAILDQTIKLLCHSAFIFNNVIHQSVLRSISVSFDI